MNADRSGEPRRGRERGGTLVEASLTLTLLLGVTFSLFDLGWILFLNQSMAHLARTGARYAVVHPNECNSTRCATAEYVILYGTPTNRGGNGTYGLRPAQVSVVRMGTPNTPDDRIEARITGFSYNILTPFFASGGTKNISVRVTFPVENFYGL